MTTRPKSREEIEEIGRKKREEKKVPCCIGRRMIFIETNVYFESETRER